MKKSFFTILISVSVLAACSETEETTSNNTSLVDKSEQNLLEQETEETVTEPEQAEEKEIIGINLWPKLGVYQMVDGKLKWKKSVSFGRELPISGDTTINKKEYKYVKLAEGVEGWMSSYCIAEDAQVAVATTKMTVYSDPTPTSPMADLSINKGEIIVIYNKDISGFVPFVTKERKSKGYLKVSRGLSKDVLDIEAASVLAQILSKENNDDLIAGLEGFLENEDYKTGTFGTMASEKLDELTEQKIMEAQQQASEAIEETPESTEEPLEETTEEVEDI